MPGVTRDLITERVPADDYLLMDTGGIGLFTEKATPKVIADAGEEQVSFAIQAAEVILLVTKAPGVWQDLPFETAIDHILVKNAPEGAVKRFDRYCPDYYLLLSDHAPVYVDIEL